MRAGFPHVPLPRRLPRAGPAGPGAARARRSFLVMAVALGLAWGIPAGPARGEAGAAPGFETETLTIETAAGRHRFRVEVARTPQQRAQGLMFRRRLAPDAGMLFVYPTDRRVLMWMKNTYLSLDILFIAGDGRLVHTVEAAEPLSTRLIPSTAPVRGVLELPAGTAARLGIRAGDTVRYPAFRAGGAER